MYNFVYITDLHIHDRTPVSRTDDYLETSKIKLRRVIKHAQEKGCSSIVCGGDVFGTAAHARNLSWRAWHSIAEIIAESKLPWYINVGQHDLTAHSHESLWDMPLGALSYLKNVTILPNDTPIQIGETDGRPVILVGRWFDHARSQSPEFFSLDGIRTGAQPQPWIIFTAHGLLVDEPFFGEFVLLKDVPPSEADLFLASDYHPGWKEIQKPSSWGVNNGAAGITNYLAPGSLMRPAKTTRIPYGLHIGIGEPVGIIHIPIPVANEENPFRFDAPEPIKEHVVEEKSFDLKSEIDKAEGTIHWVDPVEQVRQLTIEQKSSDAVKSCTLELVEKAQEILGGEA